MRSTDPAGSRRHWYRDLSIRTRILGLTGVLLLGLVGSLVSGIVNGNRASDLQAQADAAELIQKQVETARYDLLWAANWQNITAWRSRVDGGAVKNNLLCQLQADMLGIPVIRPKNAEATIFGAMLLAGLTTGVYASLDELEAKWAVDRVFEPQMSRDEADAKYAGWREARELTKGWTKKVDVS